MHNNLLHSSVNFRALTLGEMNKLEQLEFKLEKLLGFRNMQEKLEEVF